MSTGAALAVSEPAISRDKYTTQRLEKTEGVAEAPVRVVPRPVWLVALACMRDTTGAEIERQLEAMRVAFAQAVISVALRERFWGYERNWESWRARRLAVIMIVLAYLCRRGTYHGETLWLVRGIPVGALLVATRVHSMILGQLFKKKPGRSTLHTDICELVEEGLMKKPAQFAAAKVPPWARGRKKANGQQWAFCYYFLTVCPWPVEGLARIVPVPRGRDVKAPRAPTAPEPALVRDERRGRDKQQAERVAESLHLLSSTLGGDAGPSIIAALDAPTQTPDQIREGLALVGSARGWTEPKRCPLEPMELPADADTLAAREAGALVAKLKPSNANQRPAELDHEPRLDRDPAELEAARAAALFLAELRSKDPPR